MKNILMIDIEKLMPSREEAEKALDEKDNDED